ncbi:MULTISPECIES: gamma-glutamyltransferase [Sphingomonas]|uniref:gamma-glutamyltransferase n=1 Tax=Sphingomonas TaxID=13687 RepID=UPI0009598479|nr:MULTISPECIES: gamma-glutamyltransferase [unclassified Sphingomonas]MBN8812241.1 gamma-glutamyltransferase [Sphingomonas sp.]OJY47947.1 MAG: gamma-glutamyltransferase [Sphingomonas sp. 67-41]
MKKLFLLLALLAAPAAASAQGVVSAADPRAAAAGTEILNAGGSATDAAIATMLALNVVEPQSAGIGGGAFFLQYDVKTGKIATVDGREAAPMAANDHWFYGPDGQPLSHMAAVPGGRSVGVPGTLRAMAKAHARAGKLPWARLFDPAIRLAREGFDVSPRLANALRNYAPHVDAGVRAIYYHADGTPLAAGARATNPQQAALLERVAKFGPDSFYVGPQAEKLIATVNGSARNPSKMTVGDLAAYDAKERPVLCSTYRAYKICSMGPPSSGGVTVMMILAQLERFDMAKLGKDNPVAWHLFAESSRLAYADRDLYVGDPDYVQVPIAGLLDRAYLAGRSALISPGGTMAEVKAGTPPGAPKRIAVKPQEVPGTTSLSVVDKAGNVAQVTTTIEGAFGSGLSVDGVMLNNELTDFDIVPEKDGYLVANRVEGGKRPRSSMAPTIVYGPDGKVRIAIGAAGGSTIIAQVAKALIGVIDWKLSAQDAIGLGLLYAPGKMAVAEKGTQLDAMVPALQALGEKVQSAPLGLKMNAVERVGARWTGGADPRSEGVVMDQQGHMTVIHRVGAQPNRPSE